MPKWCRFGYHCEKKRRNDMSKITSQYCAISTSNVINCLENEFNEIISFFFPQQFFIALNRNSIEYCDTFAYFEVSDANYGSQIDFHTLKVKVIELHTEF